MLLLLWRISVWLKGDSPHNPPNLGLKRTQIVVDEAIPIQDYWSDYKQNRRTARKIVQDVTDRIKTTLDRLIEVD